METGPTGDSLSAFPAINRSFPELWCFFGPGTTRCRAKPQRLRPLTEPKEITMKKLILAVALTFALVAGAVTVTALWPLPAMADPGNCNGC